MKRIGIISLFLAAILVIAWLALQGSSEEVPAVADARSRPPEPSVDRKVSQTPLLPIRQVISEATAEKRHVSAVRRSEEVLRAALSSDKDLATFKLLSDKALRTAEEERRYRGMISNRERLLAAKDDLLDLDPSQEHEMRRIVQVKFLADSFLWEDNPEKEYASQVLKDVIMAEFPADTSKELLKSLYGDKIELYQYLLLGDRPEAEKIWAMATGTRLEKVFRLAANLTNRRVPAEE